MAAVLAADRNSIHLRVAEPSWVGKRAELWIQKRVSTQRKGGFDASYKRPAGTLILAAEQTLPVEHLQHAFHYTGELVEVQWSVRVEIDDGVLFDSKLDLPLTLPEFPRAVAQQGEAARQLYDPADQRSLRARFRALLPEDRRKLLKYSALGAALVLINLAIGWHDAGVPESDVWLYDHAWSSGGPLRSSTPIMKAIVGSLLFAGALSFHLALGLVRYIRFGFKIRTLPKRGVRIPAAQLVRGVARVPLEGAEVRVVVANVELGRIRSGSGSSTTIEQAGRAICLFRQALPRVPALMPIENYLIGDVDFSQVYDTLFPTAMIGTLGIQLRWRIQLLHPHFTDRSSNGVVQHLDPADFFPRSAQ